MTADTTPTPHVPPCGRCGQPANPPVGYFLGAPICADCDEQQGWPAPPDDSLAAARERARTMPGMSEALLSEIGAVLFEQAPLGEPAETYRDTARALLGDVYRLRAVAAPPDAAPTAAERQYGLLLSEHLALKEEVAIRRERAERAWTYPPITDLDRANEEVRRLHAYITEWASSQWDGDREQRYRDDPAWLKSAWHFCGKMWGEAALEAHHLHADVATLKRQIDVLVGFLVAYAPDCATQLKFYVLERDRLMAQVRELKREIGIQNEANRRHKDERAAMAPLQAAALAYGAAWWAVESEARRLRASGREPTAEALGALLALMLVSPVHATQAALHAAYAVYAQAGEGAPR